MVGYRGMGRAGRRSVQRLPALLPGRADGDGRFGSSSGRQRGRITPSALLSVAVVVNALDLVLSWGVVSRYGLGVEANPLMAGALAFGLLGGIAMKSSLLAVVAAAAALNPPRARALVGGVAFVGAVGVISALVA